MEHRVTITYPGPIGEDLADRLMDALIACAAHAGPVLSESNDTFRVVLAVAAHDLQDAHAIANDIASEALRTAGLERAARGAEVELVDVDEPAPVSS
jgi:hypothetical protein